MSIDVRTPQGDIAGSVELPAEIFDVQANIPLIHQVVVAQLAAARQGTADTKTRAEVSGGGRKPYRQKGTGRARQGSIRAPHYAGGGISHGPTPRNYAQRTPKKMKVAALRGALSDRARSGRVHVISGIVEGAAPSTKQAIALLSSITDRRHVLLVLERDDLVGGRSVRNVEGVHTLWPDQLNTYDVLVSDDVVFTRGALDLFLGHWGHAAVDGPASSGSADDESGSEADETDAAVAGDDAEADEPDTTEAGTAPSSTAEDEGSDK
jgi:large subunit ribosomal protein L4